MTRQYFSAGLVLAGVVLLAGCPKPQQQPAGDATPVAEAPPAVPQPVPGAEWTGDAKDFTFTSHDGTSAKLSDFAGKPLVLNFWADWCGPCRAEFPDFQAAWSESDGRYNMVSITDRSSADPKGFVEQNGYSWLFGISDEAPRLYQLQGWPTTIFIDAAGNIKETQLGGLDKAGFEAKLASII